MSTFIADLHLHSKFSRATSKQLCLRHLAAWAEIKGVDVLATGDFTHPAWMDLIRTELVEKENGLLGLKNQSGLGQDLPWMARDLTGAVQFMLCTEISSIYKKNGRVRKNHNLVFMPGLAAAEDFNRKLAQVGNIASDGRPILGLDARDLLEMVLDTHAQAFVIPAHIWTPWFSLFGSKSGFDSIEECFGDLTSEIFALETGLSSDPEMNWTWSALDRFTLVSNSDAHSGEKLAREANIFDGERSYAGIRSALRQEQGPTHFGGTVEFYPEEGKYHLDGHRKCGVSLHPRETAKYHDLCPVCDKPLTIGVLHRVTELADRAEPQRPQNHPGFVSLVPLKEILGEILGVGPGAKKVAAMYGQLVREFGSELDILRTLPPDALNHASAPLAEAVQRMRQGLVRRESGFDGEYGRISMFAPEELRELRHGRSLAMSGNTVQERPTPEHARPLPEPMKLPAQATAPNTDQQSAILAGPGPVLVLAGPGTGKTHTLMARMRHLLEHGADPSRMLIVTFTRRAARELQERLQQLWTDTRELPRADTLHALALEEWSKTYGQPPTLVSDDNARRIFALANPDLQGRALRTAWNDQALARETRETVESTFIRNYAAQKAAWKVMDFTDLLEFWLKQTLQSDFLTKYTHVLVDEIQDLSPLQLDVLVNLAAVKGNGFFAIGDPNQSIYAFRGAARDVQARLLKLWPDLQCIRLIQNYRSCQEILTLSAQVLGNADILQAQQRQEASLALFTAQTAEQEALWIADRARELIGGTGHWQADTGGQTMAPGDIAVLVRFKALMHPLRRTLENAGLPVSTPEAEAFFTDERVVLLLQLAATWLGLSDAKGKDLPACPAKTIQNGPRAMATYLAETPPFDRVFWTSRAFTDLEKSFRTAGGWRETLNLIELETELGAIRSKAQKIQIMTLHAAKGLEFEAVFLPGLEQGILPFVGMDALLGANCDEVPDLEEERRLFYVGLTRAKSHLYLSHCHSRKIYSATLRLQPSSFLSDLPLELLRKTTLAATTRHGQRQLRLF